MVMPSILHMHRDDFISPNYFTDNSIFKKKSIICFHTSLILICYFSPCPSQVSASYHRFRISILYFPFHEQLRNVLSFCFVLWRPSIRAVSLPNCLRPRHFPQSGFCSPQKRATVDYVETHSSFSLFHRDLSD